MNNNDKIEPGGWVVIGMFVFAIIYGCVIPTRPQPEQDECPTDLTVEQYEEIANLPDSIDPCDVLTDDDGG